MKETLEKYRNIIVNDFLNKHLDLEYGRFIMGDDIFWFEMDDLLAWLDDYIPNSGNSFDVDIKEVLQGYGIKNDYDIQYMYEHIIIEAIKRYEKYLSDHKDELNESINKEDKRKKYINTIVNDLVQNTSYRLGDDVIPSEIRFILPFHPQQEFFVYGKLNERSIPDQWFTEFYRYCKDRYGISSKEMLVVEVLYVLRLNELIERLINK
jgi:hypothetical protein